MTLDETCSVCGRTILAGERTRGYVSAQGRRGVCDLCVPRAERLGWQRDEEGMPATLEPPEKRRGLGGLLRRRPKREPLPLAEPESLEERDYGYEYDDEGLYLDEAEAGKGDRAEEAAEGLPGHEHEPELAPEAEVEPEPEPDPTSRPDPAAPGARPQRLEPQFETSSLSPFERAVARFNASETSRTVAGLTRTLGPPWVSVGAVGGSPREVRITVAWELSWYQWGVDLGDESRPVFQLDKGLEMDQLDAAARQWNASAVEGGRIVLVAPRRSGAGSPTGR